MQEAGRVSILANEMVRKTGVGGGRIGRCDFFDPDVLEDNVDVFIGAYMENLAAEMEVATKAVANAKKEYQKTFNEMKAMSDVLTPLMQEQIKEVRSARMSVVNEFQSMLASMKEVRKFFLEAEHDKEVARLKEFVSLCDRMIELKKSGMLDAIGDTIIKIALKEEGGK